MKIKKRVDNPQKAKVHSFVTFLHPAASRKGSAVYIVVLRQQIHGSQELVYVNKGSDNNEGAQNVPAPERACTEAIGNIAAIQFLTDSVGNLVEPHNIGNAKGKPREHKGNQAEMHGLFAIIARGDGVDIRADRGQYDDSVDAEGNQGKQNKFQQTSLGGKLANRSSGRGIGLILFHGIHTSFFFFVSCRNII